MDELTRLANRFGSDKGSRGPSAHLYTRIYHDLFGHMRGARIRLLELGLLHIADPAWDDPAKRNAGGAVGRRAPSLQMWSHYFPKGEIFGFDINDFSAVRLPRCRILRGDVGDRADLARLAVESGGGFDIIIDDASHASHHQQIALGALFPALRDGGLYAIEDLRFQPEDLEIAGAARTLDMLRRAEVTGAFGSDYLTPAEADRLSRGVARVMMFDDLGTAHSLRRRDALAVLVKRR